ncbi:hypothetical protein PS659_04326 [Pseudomonas fluorescens]|uniref:Uncharacterized protein n=1 Tax=Pseudomonas fluorescens TaxID=294 RepID=A0A5E6VW38_PSEFL|nr:hypothetical protein PS659_04326 [Pseudomonas fluorescens]
MVVNDNAINLTAHGVLGFFASRLAPTGERVAQRNSLALTYRRMMGTDRPASGCGGNPGFLDRVM